MNTSEALLAAVLANPQDDLTRLVYADYLEENREPEQAAFIRAQIAGGKGRAEFLAWGDRYLTDDAGAAHLIPHLNEAGGPTVVYRRGFVAEVTCTLAEWCGTECDYCHTTGYAEDISRAPCPQCNGEGHTTGIGPVVVRSHPVEVVRLTDREPLSQWDQFTWWHLNDAAISPEQPYRLPADIWDGLGGHWVSAVGPPQLLKHYDTVEDANSALSAVLIAWAKSQPHPARITSTPVAVDVTT